MKLTEEDLKKLFSSTGTFRELLEYILEDLTPNHIVPRTDYDNPAWAYKQADRNGYIRALDEIKSLIR